MALRSWSLSRAGRGILRSNQIVEHSLPTPYMQWDAPSLTLFRSGYLVSIDGQPAGWCQWYRWGDYPAEAKAVDAQDGEVGADYAIGNADLLGRGFGTAMITALISEVRRHHPGAGMVIAPEAANVPSRRILEKNGFRLESVRPLATERHDRPMAVYRLASAGVDSAAQR